MIIAMAPAVQAQTDHEVVMATIDQFFEGFAAGDTTLMWPTVDRDARLVLTSSDETGQPTLRIIPIDAFMTSMARPRQTPMREAIWNPEIRVVDNLAAVWVNYNVWVGDRIDHCGVDHFQLARTTDGWKMIAIADTQQRTGCVAHEE